MNPQDTPNWFEHPVNRKGGGLIHLHALYNPKSADCHRYIFMTQPATSPESVYIEERRGLEDTAKTEHSRDVSIPKDKDWAYLGLPPEEHTHNMKTLKWEDVNRGRALWIYLTNKGWKVATGDAIFVTGAKYDRLPVPPYSSIQTP